MFKQHHFQKSEPKKTAVKIRDRLKVGDRVMFVGDDINNTPGIYDTAGTVENIDPTGLFVFEVEVHWDDGSYQEEDIDDLEIIDQKQKTKADRRKTIRSSSSKVEHQIENVLQLRQKVNEIRSGWFGGETKRQGEGYAPSEHDKIKFNINLYLGQMMQFFVGDIQKATAVVLDSDDLGTSATLKAFNFNTENIYVPNYYVEKQPVRYVTEYRTMKKKVTDLGCFPIGLQSFFQAWGESNDDKTFQKHLMDIYHETTYNTKPRIKKPLPKYFSSLDFAYLDYCNMFETEDDKTGKSNQDTVNYMFKKGIFPTETPYVLAITGSLMFVSKDELNSTLERYKKAVIKSARRYGYTNLREDQFFVYNRSHQQGEVEEVIAHRNPEDIPKGIQHKEVSHSSKMFFMSFVGGANKKKLVQWDSLFKICNGGQCKLQLGHRECLYQRGKDRLHLSKPFCNYRITEFYFADPENLQRQQFLTKFQDVPMLESEEVVDALEFYNKRSRLPEGIRKSYKNNHPDIIDITRLIETVNDARKQGGAFTEFNGRTIHLDETFYIDGFIASGTVSVECILGNIVGIHFTDSDKIEVPGIKHSSEPKPNILTSCFLIHVADLVKIIKKEPKGEPDYKESEEEEEESELPYDLHYINESRLSKLSVKALRQECSTRDIKISSGAQKNKCISKLLEWKKAQKAGSDSEEEEEGSELPYDLEYVGDVRLSKLSVQALRQECSTRDIKISSGAQKNKCISKLLEWKKAGGSKEDSDESDSDSELPYDLHYINESRLSKLSVKALRQECSTRDIKISSGAGKNICISKLLEWKKAQKNGEPKE